MANFSLEAFMAATNAGMQINQSMEEKQQDIELKKQAVQQNSMKMAMEKQQFDMQQKQQAAMQKLIADEDQKTTEKLVKSGELPDGEKEAAITKEVESYRQKAKIYLMGGDAKNAEAYSKMADSAEARKTTTEKKNLEIAEKRTKDLASYAGAVLEGDVTDQEAFETVKNKVGLKAALSIPADAAGKRKWWETKQKEGLTANEQLSKELAVKKSDEDRKERAREANQNAELKRMMIAATAANRENKAPHTEEIGGKKYEYDPENKLKGTRLETDSRYVELGAGKSSQGDKTANRYTQGAVNAAAEAVRSLNIVSTMSAGLTAGALERAGDPHTVLGSLTKVGGNKLTKEEAQMYQTTMKGMDLEMAQAATLGTGRAPTKAIIEEFGDMMVARPGDTKYETMYRIANGAGFLRTRLKTLPPHPDPGIQKVREETMKALEKYPVPEKIYEAAKAAGHKVGKGQVEKSTQRLSEALAEVDKETGRGHPQEIQDLLEKYK